MSLMSNEMTAETTCAAATFSDQIISTAVDGFPEIRSSAVDLPK